MWTETHVVQATSVRLEMGASERGFGMVENVGDGLLVVCCGAMMQKKTRWWWKSGSKRRWHWIVQQGCAQCG